MYSAQYTIFERSIVYLMDIGQVYVYATQQERRMLSKSKLVDEMNYTWCHADRM